MPEKPLDHWLSFRDRMMVHPVMQAVGVDYAEVVAALGPERAGFAHFVETKSAKAVMGGGMVGYGPAVKEIYQTAVWDACGRHVIRPSPGLFDLLVHTEAKVPIRDVHPPFPSVYIALPPGRIKIPDVEGDRLVEAEGCYASWCSVGPPGAVAHIHSLDDIPLSEFSDHCRVLYVARGVHDRKRHDWTVRYQNLAWMDDESGSVDQLIDLGIERQVASKDKIARLDPLLNLPGVTWEEHDVDRILIRLVANLFLYMSCPDAEVLENPGELQQRLKDLKARRVGSKRRKSVKRQIHASMEINEMIIGGSIKIEPLEPAPEGPDAPGQGRRSPKPHWRRGHFRGIRRGKGRTEVKITWIRPVLVRKAIAGQEAPESKGYEVR